MVDLRSVCSHCRAGLEGATICHFTRMLQQQMGQHKISNFYAIKIIYIYMQLNGNLHGNGANKYSINCLDVIENNGNS